MENSVIKLEGIYKKYSIYHEKPTFIENILSRKKVESFWALKNVNLRISKGDTVGVVGPNGAGKTTLLEIIAGITHPTSGKISIKGKIVSLIELEAGFHPELTGEENIFIIGQLIGMSKKEIKEKFSKIVNFAEIGEFINAPFFTYSSGMALRLGFSIAIHSDPDIFVLDENLAVGDKDFQIKTKKTIKKLFRHKTVILATHWIDFIKENCNKVLYLDSGTIREYGDINILNKYFPNPKLH